MSSTDPLRFLRGPTEGFADYRLPTSPAVGAAEGPIWGGNFSGRFVSSGPVMGGGQPLVLRPLVHGNSALSPRTAYVYGKYAADGTFRKWGLTQNLAKRYSKAQLRGGWLDEVANGPRAEMLKVERNLVETRPGQDNLERWAGKRAGGQ